MDDNNFMNNDNQSSGTPDNTGVFGQSAGAANGSDTYTHPTPPSTKAKDHQQVSTFAQRFAILAPSEKSHF